MSRVNLNTRLEYFGPHTVFSLPTGWLIGLGALVAIILGFVGIDSFNRFAGWGLTTLWWCFVAGMALALVLARTIDRRMARSGI